MSRNLYTTKLIDLMATDDKYSSKYGLFIVMESMDSDLKKLLNSAHDELTL
jgi:hypothetical protein